MWFAGVHSNVGGGYPKQGMSFVALDWMLEQASQAGRPFDQHGLRFNASERDWFREHASVDDKLYDPRAGAGVFYRWRIRDIGRICKAHGVQPKIHVSALERIAHGTDDYSPGNLPAHAEVIFTPPPSSANVELAERRAAAMQRELATIPGGTLLARVRREMVAGQLSYYIYIVTGLVFLNAAWRTAQRSLALPNGVGWNARERDESVGDGYPRRRGSLGTSVAAWRASARFRRCVRADAAGGVEDERHLLRLLVREAGGAARRPEAGARGAYRCPRGGAVTSARKP